MHERTIYLPHDEQRVVPFKATPVEKDTYRNPMSFDHALEKLQAHADLLNDSEIWQDTVEAKWESDRPIQPILPLADLHLGHRGCHLDYLRERLEWANEYDAKLILLGDLIDGFIPGKFASGMIDQAPIQMQIDALRAFLREYQDRILCNVATPHHDGWSYEATGIDLHRIVAEEMNIPLLEPGGLLNVAVNGVPYQYALFHKIAKFNSALNLTNASKRVIDKHADADFVISGHLHKSATEVLDIRGKRRGLMVVGTLKGDDKWGKRQGFIGGVDINRFPTMMLRTDEKDFELVDSPKSAGEWLDGVRLLYNSYAQTARMSA